MKNEGAGEKGKGKRRAFHQKLGRLDEMHNIYPCARLKNRRYRVLSQCPITGIQGVFSARGVQCNPNLFYCLSKKS